MKIYNDANRFVIDWTLNSLCTYHCSYCHPMFHRGTNFIYDREKDPEIILNFLNKLYSQIQGRSVHVFINGGEPTISPSLETILDFCYEKKWCAYINTNGSRSMDWWQEYAKKAFKVTISYHPETVVDDEIFEKVEYIGTQTNVGVFTLMYPPLWDKALNAYNRFKAMPRVTIAPSRVFKREHVDKVDVSYDYSEEQLKWLEENSQTIFKDNDFPPHEQNRYGNTYFDNGATVTRLDEVECVNTRQNSFVGWKCNMGIDHITVTSYGRVLQSTCKQARKISDIIDFEKLDSEPTECKTEWCMCTADVLIPKYK